MHILLAEDDHFYASMLIGLLRKAGYSDVKHLDNGVDCLLQVYEKTTPDLLIMDSHLGMVNGVEVLQKLVKHKPNLKVIILSGHLNGKKVNELVKDSILDIILKDDMVFEHLVPHLERIRLEVIQKKRIRPMTTFLMSFKRFIMAP